MNYQEKIFLADRGVEFILKGKTIGDYDKDLENQGFFNYDIIKVLSSIRNILNSKFGGEFKSLLIEDKLDSNREKYSFLDDSIFNEIKENAILNIVNDSKREIRRLLHQGVEINEIIEIVQNKYFVHDDILFYIRKYTTENDVVTTKNQFSYVTVGVVIVFVSIALSAVASAFFYGAIIVGFGLIIKGINGPNG